MNAVFSIFVRINNQSDMKKLIKLVLAVVLILLAVKLCSDNLGSVISLPGGLGKESSGESGGGWFHPKEQTDEPVISGEDADDISVKDLEKELGIGKNKGKSTTTSGKTATTTASASSTLSFKGIPMSGTLSAFGTELVKAGFKNAGNGSYTGDFAGYSGCKVTPSGSSPVQEVRVDFPVISDWDALEKAYDALKASLTQKYGIEPRTSTDNNLAIYDLPGGTITLDADVKDRSTWHVILKYANALSTATTGTLGRNPIDDL